MRERPTILVTNDDGYSSEGLLLLRRVAERFGRVLVVAPEHERSGISHAISLSDPIRIRKVDEDFYALSGTPADCVFIGMHYLLRGRPDLVLAGINKGPNLGYDVLYSGTVGGAMEGIIQGSSAIAFSLVGPKDWPFGDFEPYVEAIIGEALKDGLPKGIMLNCNFPAVRPIKGTRVVRLGMRFYSNDIIERTDPRGGKYLWIGGTRVTMETDPDTDCGAVAMGYVTLTPLDADVMARRAVQEFQKRFSGILPEPGDQSGEALMRGR